MRTYILSGFFALFTVAANGACAAASDSDWAAYVNPFVGTVRGSGSTYPGAQRPFGMVSFSPHTKEGNHGSGYQYTSDQITGFGLVHLSGVGCDATCELPFMPVTGSLEASPVTDKNTYNSLYSHDREHASPGCYSVTLDRYRTEVELTAAVRSAMGRFRYPAGDTAHVIFNPTASANGLRDGVINIDVEQNSISGWIKGGGFCHVKTNDYVIYYTAVFDKAFNGFGVWLNGEKKAGETHAAGDTVAAYVSFDTGDSQAVMMKAGISFVSLANARENLQSEVPGWDLQAVKEAARADWNHVLGRIEVDGGTTNEKTLFYTALYHSVMLPNIFEDVNGQYVGMDGRIYTARPGHHVYSTFSGWDTYRTQAPLWGLLYPQAASDLCQTFLETSRQTELNGGGGLPLWSMFNDETLIMSGYPAAPYIAGAYAFGARDFEVEALTEVIIRAGQENRYWGRNNHATWRHLEEYKKFGYYADDCGLAHAISQNVEYAAADFSISCMARAVGEPTHQYFLERSQSIFKLLHPTEKYLWARLKDGSWKKGFNPFSSDGCQEGTSTHYTWGIAHNLGRLIRQIGGETVAEERLDQLMAEIAFGYDYGNPHYLAGNEPCFGVVPVYNWIGRPWKAQLQMRRVMEASFADKPDGIPGDDDSGAMSAWYVFAALGLYPEVPGIGGFAVTGPLFPKVTLNLETGRQIIITAKGAGSSSPYIRAMRVNGQPFEQTWLAVDPLIRSAKTTVEFTMSREADKSWASEYRPPSWGPLE